MSYGNGKAISHRGRTRSLMLLGKSVKKRWRVGLCGGAEGSKGERRAATHCAHILLHANNVPRRSTCFCLIGTNKISACRTDVLNVARHE